MNIRNIYTWLFIFSIAMGFLETAVVVYLREILYPEGFDFPLQVMDPSLAVTEIGREAATLFMLIGVGILAGRTKVERFGMFLFAFAVWDIFYYVFLKLLLDWPPSLLTWDILFLIPTTWTGPVITPVLLSLAMIGLAISISQAVNKDDSAKIEPREWWLLISGSVVVIIAFVWDYSSYVLDRYGFSKLFWLSEQEIAEVTGNYIPTWFNWPVFLAGLGLITAGILLFRKRASKQF